jgi:hypothetical protein
MEGLFGHAKAWRAWHYSAAVAEHVEEEGSRGEGDAVVCRKVEKIDYQRQEPSTHSVTSASKLEAQRLL